MKILISCFDFGSRSSLFSQKARAAVVDLATQGHQVTVLTNSDYHYAGERVQRELPPSVRVLEVDCYAEIPDYDENILKWRKMIPSLLRMELQDGAYEIGWHLLPDAEGNLLWRGPFGPTSRRCPIRGALSSSPQW